MDTHIWRINKKYSTSRNILIFILMIHVKFSYYFLILWWFGVALFYNKSIYFIYISNGNLGCLSYLLNLLISMNPERIICFIHKFVAFFPWWVNLVNCIGTCKECFDFIDFLVFHCCFGFGLVLFCVRLCVCDTCFLQYFLLTCGLLLYPFSSVSPFFHLVYFYACILPFFSKHWVIIIT